MEFKALAENLERLSTQCKGNFLNRQRLQILDWQLHRKAPHYVLHREDYAAEIFLPDNDPFKACKRAGTDASALSGCQQGVRLGLALLQPGTQCQDGRIRKRSGLPACSHDQRHSPGYLQHSSALTASDAYK